MNTILAILKTLSDPKSHCLLYCGTFGPGWVNDKSGPKVSARAFRLLKESQLITPLNRVTKWTEGPWYTISEEGKQWLTLLSLKNR